MADPARRLRAAYGAGPRHLVLVLASLAVAGWVALRLAGAPMAGWMLVWFVGAALVHDLFLFPVYAAADAALRRLLPGGPRTANAGRVSALNHVRVPALAAALLFLVYLPGILGLGRPTYAAATGLPRHAELVRWLWLTGALFLAGAVTYAVRVGRRRRARRSGPPVIRS
ncbi:hypothetical protein ACFY2R_21540 [Micromonospora olivasterospora]|uniref:Uncharacterized protein n=1 Tax=Micromonospora olivasterospora TaxID=1880 RepID=A0A562I2Q2_MICOL|nr:hypothetical protein [Micromonospora olivasterospora]TWH65076.1 hypothetical protein JD77_00011 [Micromonospora olivasterospora]